MKPVPGKNISSPIYAFYTLSIAARGSRSKVGLGVHVFAPCALGGILNSSTIPAIAARIVAGAANNQLEDEIIHSRLLETNNILYCPDYVINAGGLINVYNEMIGYNEQRAFQQVNNIYETLLEIFDRAQKQGITTNDASKQLAEDRILKARHLKTMAVA